MADKAKTIMDTVAGYFAAPTPKPITRDLQNKAKADVAKKFATNPDMDYNTKIKKALGMN